MYTYDDYYEDDVINESALDMAIDMSDRYGVAVEDAYDFVCDAMEGSLKDPHKRELRERGRHDAALNSLYDTAIKSGERSAAYRDWQYTKNDEDLSRVVKKHEKNMQHIKDLNPIDYAMFGHRERKKCEEAHRKADEALYRRQDHRIKLADDRVRNGPYARDTSDATNYYAHAKRRLSRTRGF